MRKDAYSEVPDFELARFVYNAQVQQIERAGVTAQALIYALTLLAAFSSPLVVAKPAPGKIGLAIGITLLLFFVSIAAAAFWTLRVMYVGRGQAAEVSPDDEVRPFLYSADIAQFASPADFGAYASALTDGDQLAQLYRQSWQLAHLAQRKSRATVYAVKWTMAALLLFLLIAFTKFLELNIL